MNQSLFFTLILCYFCLENIYAQHNPPQSNITKINTYIKNTPVAFEQNKGQIYDFNNNPASYVKYHYKKRGINIFLLQQGITYQFNKIHYPEGYEHLEQATTAEDRAKKEMLQQDIRLETYRIDMHLTGANPNPIIIKEGKSRDYTNYYNYDVLDVHSFQKIIYQNIYHNIDWVIYTTKEGIKYDFIVHPGADPNQIKMTFSHHEGLNINKDGSFSLSNSMGTITEKKPISFQGDKSISTQFQLENNTISFQLSSYNPNQDLTIDPSLVWATYYGGGDNDSQGKSSVDNNGNVYLTGLTESISNIAAIGHQNTYSGSSDAFLVKFNSNGIRQWATYYGGTGRDGGTDCITDNNNNVYLMGSTNASVPTTAGSHQAASGGMTDAFLVKFNTNGIRQWATHYGGSNRESPFDCTIDNNNNIYLSGFTQSNDSIANNGHQNILGGGFDAFLVKLNTNGVRQWATYYGGIGIEFGFGCTVDNNNNIYLAGTTNSTTNISNNGYQNNNSNGLNDAFLVKFNPSGVRQWATYYGGNGNEEGFGCTVDYNNDVYLIGDATSTTAIASGGHQNTFGGNIDGFLVKFTSSGIRQWATYYGGNGLDRINTCSSDNNIYISGYTASTTDIASGGHQNTYAGGTYDAFLAKFTSSGIRQWATYYGGSNTDLAASCPLDNNGNIYLSGATRSTNNIASNGHQNSLASPYDGFLAKFQDSVTLLSTNLQKFEAHRITNDNILLEWEVGEMNQIKQFIIERSFDTNFEPIATLKNNQLSLVDHISTNTTVYYRLKIISKEESIIYSTIKAVKGNTLENNIAIYPNPTTGKITITTAQLLKNTSVSIITLNGQVQKKIILDNAYTLLDISALPNAIYIVKIQSNEGSSNIKLIKK